MSEIAKSKTEIESELSKINQVNKIIGQKLDLAKASGNTNEYDSLINDLRTMKDREDFLQNNYTKLMTQEADLQVAEVSKKMDVLRKKVPVPFSSPMQSMGMPGATALSTNQQSPKEVDERNRQIVAEIYNLPVGKGGREAEKIPTSLMAQVQTLYDPTSKSQLLEKTYGKGNVLPVDVGGNTEFFIKSPDGSVKTTLDKGIAGLAGIATEAPVVASEIASFLGILGSTKSPVAANVGSAATGAVVGSGIDTALRMSYGLNPDFGGTIARRGTGAVIGAGTGMLTDFAIPAYRAARIPDPFENKFVKVLDESADRLMRKEEKLAASQGRAPGEVNVPVGARLAGQQGIDMQSELAGTYAGSGIATGARNSQESLIRLSNDVKSNIPVTASDFSGIALNQQKQQEALVNSISQKNQASKSLVEGAVDRILKPRATVSTDELGGFLRSAIKDAEDQSVKSTNEQYDVLADVADQAGFQITATELIDMLPAIKSKINVGGAFDDSAVRGVENRLKEVRDAPGLIMSADDRLIKATSRSEIQDLKNEIKRLQAINKPLDFKAFDAYIRAFNDARPDGGAVGGTTKDVFGAGISAELSQLRRDIYSRFNATMPDGTIKNLGDEFQKATELVQARGAFEKNTLGGILKEAGGEAFATQRQIVNSVMSDPAKINRVLQAAKELEAADPSKAGTANNLQEMMRKQYLDNLGMGSKRGVTSLDHDQGMLDSLYGSKSGAAARGLDSLNEKLRVLRSADVPSLTLTDLNALSSALGKDARDKVAESIVKRDVLQKQEEALVRSDIFKAAKRGDFKNVDPDILSKSILGGNTIGETEVVMAQLSKLSPSSRNIFKGDFMRNLLNEFPHGEVTANAPFMPLFDTKKFLSAYETSPGVTSQFGKKLEIVLGKEQAQELADIARLYNANMITDVSATGFVPRFTATNNGVILGIPFGQLGSSVRNRYITAMLSSGSQRIALKRALAKNAMPGAVNKAYNDMAKEMFLTRTGLESLAHQASSDPEFSAELTNMAKQFKEKQGINFAADMINMERSTEK
jgi:hypothetical protein